VLSEANSIGLKMSSVEQTLPYLKLATALIPFAAALLVRVAAGGNRFTRMLLSLATTWFAVNVLLAPFTDVAHVGNWLR
jgi:hypothetical protein